MRRLRTVGSLILTLCAAAVVTSCGDGTITGGDSSGETDQISVRNNFFSPTTSTVPTGTTVTWTWAASADAHTVTFDDGPNSGVLSSGTYQRTFGVAGTYDYLCQVHGAGMSGTIVVEDP